MPPLDLPTAAALAGAARAAAAASSLYLRQLLRRHIFFKIILELLFREIKSMRFRNLSAFGCRFCVVHSIMDRIPVGILVSWMAEEVGN